MNDDQELEIYFDHFDIGTLVMRTECGYNIQINLETENDDD